MKRCIVLGEILIAMSASVVTLSAAPASVITKLPRGEKPVKVNGVYVFGNSEYEKNGQDTGLRFAGKTRKTVSISENVIFALDSVVGRMENGDFTVKETYRYDDNGNSLEACYYNWNYGAEDWDMNKKVTAGWNSSNKMTSEETLFYSPWGDTGSRNVFVYDGNGLNIETDVYMLEEGEWMPSQKSFFKYDSYGNMTEELIQVPAEASGEWINLQKNVATWTPTGLRTLAEVYLWDGSEWIPADGRLAYEFDDKGRMTNFLNDIWVDGEWRHFLRVRQKWGEYGLTYQTYELWNDDSRDWYGDSILASSYAEFAYDEEGRNISETGYAYDRDKEEWYVHARIESVYTDLGEGITRQFQTSLDVVNDRIVEEVIREYNQAGNDTYYKQTAISPYTGQFLPFEEKYATYADDGKSLLAEEDYLFAGETRMAFVKQSHEYDAAGYPVESWYQHGRLNDTGEGDPEEWMNYSHFTYGFENGEELSRMAYFWQDGEYVPGWGEATEFNFNVAISECLFWMDQSLDVSYQITASRIYQPDGNEWTYEEGTWYYSDLGGAAVDAIEENETVRVYPNPASDYIHVDCQEGAAVDIYSISGALMVSARDRTVDVSGLAKGIYIVNADGKSTRLIKK